MSIEEIFSLAILQGLTEFLPISSSAHLILLPLLLDWEDQGLAFDVAVHVGTLLAVVTYFRKDIKRMACAWFASILGKGSSQGSRLAWMVILGTIPAGIAGLLLNDFVETNLRSPIVIATATIVFGIFLGWSDRYGNQSRVEEKLTIKDALIIGLFQMLALIPGTSRSGITMAGGLMLGLTRQTAARFSFLLSMPLISLAGGHKTLDLVTSKLAIDWAELLAGAAISAISAFLCIELFLRLVEKIGMMPFVIYRLVLGVFLLAVYFP
ncbi:MAG: undecaprenyl-diphosphatase [Cycloclasticus sp. symbiont of Poecilosclerida sp. M]|nr:MAG: undecaprenyl-diphosphatase [Cycloclasticus sp. symbiont of Poecilosclerida sp. M]